MRGLWQAWSTAQNAPSSESWFFIASEMKDENDIFYIYACSEECKAGVWKKGPGERWGIHDCL